MKISGFFINLQTDYGFKRMFGNIKNKRVLIRFLNAIFGDDIHVTDVEYHDKELLPSEADGKRIIYDIYCTSEIPDQERNLFAGATADDGRKTHHFILEMQNLYDPRFEDRMAYYTSRMVAGQGKAGWDYTLEHVITVVVTDFDLNRNAPRLVRNIGFADTETRELLTDKIRMVFLSLKCIERKRWEECGTELERILYIIKNMDKMSKTSKPYMEGDYEEMFEAATMGNMASEELVAYSDSLQKLRDTQAGIEYASRQAYDDGEQKGRKEGLKEGLLKAARNLLAYGASTEMVVAATGLTPAQLDKLREDL